MPGNSADGTSDGQVVVPACVSSKEVVDRNPIRQVLIRSQAGAIQRASGRTYVDLEDGLRVRVAARATRLNADDFTLILTNEELADGTNSEAVLPGRWVGPNVASTPDEVLASLVDGFAFHEENPAESRPGLRSPQLGALHSILGYWTTRPSEPATVVMPTGTGKTETMLAVFAASPMARLLVVVPSDVLRTQIAEKFESLGILQQAGVVSRASHRPVVGRVQHAFGNGENARTFGRRCNVVVSTPSALAASSTDVRTGFLREFTHLFVDEAHHVAATTWRQIRDEFESKPVVQFTATPYREDGRHLGGRLLYAYPLREAQRAGYFSTIDFISVLDLGNHDRAVAQRAVERLRADLAAGHDHLLMARVGRIGRADDVLAIYQEIAPDLAPVVLHSEYSQTRNREARKAISTRQSRVIVCVNMLGEGFDLPPLKVAAIHDPHKSLGVTLQFVGRFARSGSTIGDASVVVGRPSGDVDPSLRRLYAEDADWNAVIRDLSENAVGEVGEVSDFEAAFGSLPDEVAMRSLLPKMSTVVYKTSGTTWNPHGVLEVFPAEDLLTSPIAINERDHVAWFVTEQRQPVKWGELRTVEEVAHHLYVVYWDAAANLLYINSSNKGSRHVELATAIGGGGSTRITGENVYRVMAGIARLVPTNVGVLDVRNRSRRFSFHVGADVSEGFPIAEAQTKTKTNIFAYGYEEGERVNIGASLKGRIWSHRVAPTIKHWIDWCDYVGAKLTDEGLSVDDVMRHFIRPQVVEQRPELVPLGVEWPWELLASTSEELRIEHSSSSSLLIDVDLSVDEHDTAGPIPFTVSTPDWSLDYELFFDVGNMAFKAMANDAFFVTRSGSLPLSELLNQVGLIVHFEQDALVVPPGLLLKPDRGLPPFDPATMRTLGWTGIDLTVESQGIARRPDSIQARMIQQISSIDEWDVIIDDDGTGEIADIVAMRADDETLHVHLTHCKYVTGGLPRAQVGDLYEVCGQAQKSAQWRRNVAAMLQKLIRRERTRVQRTGVSGLVRGDIQSLYHLSDVARLRRPNFTIAIAQPGVTQAGVSVSQLELLASTDTYVIETAHATFELYCSE